MSHRSARLTVHAVCCWSSGWLRVVLLLTSPRSWESRGSALTAGSRFVAPLQAAPPLRVLGEPVSVTLPVILGDACEVFDSGVG